VEGHRYDIYEDVGCLTYVYPTVVYLVLIAGWPIYIGLVAATYSSA
jgi:pheromone a factor receptor